MNFSHDQLTLRLVRLKPAQEWVNSQSGLSFVFLKGGAGKCISGAAIQAFERGDVLVLDGDAGGKVCASDRGEMIFATFSACFEHFLPLFASNEICRLQSLTDDFKRAKLYPASSPVAMECHRLLADVPPQFNLDHRSQLLRVAAGILTVEFKKAPNHRIGFVRPENHLIQVFEKLSTAELVGLSVGELARKFGCSRRHLNRLFHQHFGVSVAALRMEMRLLKAVALLRNPDAKIINVAEECGFNHLGLFNTCFKRRFGTSPGQWRKQSVRDGSSPAQSTGLGDAAPGCPLRISGLCPWSGQPEVTADATKEQVAKKPSPARIARPGATPNAQTENRLFPELRNLQAPLRAHIPPGNP